MIAASGKASAGLGFVVIIVIIGVYMLPTSMSHSAWNLDDGPEQLSYAATSCSAV